VKETPHASIKTELSVTCLPGRVSKIIDWAIMGKIDKKTAVRLAIVVVLVLAIVWLLYAFGLFDLFTDKHLLLTFIEEHRAYAGVVFVGLQVMQVLIAFLPGEVTGFAGGVLFGPLWGIFLSLLGLTLGSWAAFNLARLLGRPVVSLLASGNTIRRFDYVMKHKGLFLAFLLFLIPGFPKDILCYILGLGHMRQVDFLIVSTLGRLMGTTLLTLGGSFFRRGHYGAFFTTIGIAVGAILFVLVYRDRVEQWVRRMHAVQRLRALKERRKLRRKKHMQC
jgi:uncharacterized membrane protein YdjX (TVP38/TMEM64 family)